MKVGPGMFPLGYSLDEPGTGYLPVFQRRTRFGRVRGPTHEQKRQMRSIASAVYPRYKSKLTQRNPETVCLQPSTSA